MLYIMRGASCSGKDTLIDHMFPDMDAHVISSDWYRHHLFGSPAIQKYGDVLFGHMQRTLEIRLEKLLPVTIWNATTLRFKDARPLIDLCDKYYHPYTFISLQPPSLEELEDRSASRFYNQIPSEVLEKHHERYESCKSPFIEHAENNIRCSFIETTQDYTVINHVE